MKNRRLFGAVAAAGVLLAGATFGAAPAAPKLPTVPALPDLKTPVATPPANAYQYSVMPAYVTGKTPAIAVINGERLSQRKFIHSLLLLNGMSLFQQWLQLTLLRQACAQAGLHVGPAQFKIQEQRVMRSLDKQGVPRQQRLAVLERILAQRGSNLLLFRIGLARAAYLEALARGHVHVTKQQIKQAYAFNYGPKLLVRDIEVANLVDAGTVRHLIMDQHKDVASVARQYSLNKQTAANGGLEIIPEHDPSLSPLFLQMALSLTKGELSAPIPLGKTYHLLWLKKTIPARDVALAAVKNKIKTKLRRVMELQWGQRKLAKLMAAANIKIYDPILNQQFQQIQTALHEQEQLMQAESKLHHDTTGVPATAP